MKILFITQNLYTLGGIQRVVNSLIDELLKTSDYDVSILMPNYKGNYKFFEVNSRVNIFKLEDLKPKKKFKMKLSKFFLALNKRTGILNFHFLNKFVENLIISNDEKENYKKFIKEQGFDVVIAAGERYSQMLGTIANDIDCKTIGWQHTTFESYFCNRGKASFGLNKVTKRLYNNLSKVLVLTKTDKKLFDNEFGINSEVYYNPLPNVETKLSFGNNNNVIFLGRLVWDAKGLKYLIEIMKKVNETLPNVTCTIVGDGPDRRKLEDIIIRKKMENNLIVVGKSNNVYKYYEKADLLLQTSKYEGFGMTIIEAMSCGVPVVSFHNYGPDEIIRNGTDGFLINKYDIDEFSKKIINILNNKKLWKRMSYAAKKRSKDFELSISTKKFINIIEMSGKK